jgi:uncharacterized protein (DUF488 family)
MAAPAFQSALARVLHRGLDRPTALMCAEAVPWRCHRQLIADAAVARGWRVLHILAPDRADPHALHPEARMLDDGRVVYPGAQGEQRELL